MIINIGSTKVFFLTDQVALFQISRIFSMYDQSMKGMKSENTVQMQDRSRDIQHITRGTCRTALAVMGNLGKPSNSPLVWTHKLVEPLRRNEYCAARFTCEKGNFASVSQSTAFRVVRSCRCDGQFCAKKAPHLSVAT